MKSFSTWLNEATFSFPDFMKFDTNPQGTGGKFTFQDLPNDPLEDMKTKVNYYKSIYPRYVEKFDDETLENYIEQLPELYHKDTFGWIGTMDAIIQDTIEKGKNANPSTDQNKKQHAKNLLANFIHEAEKWIQDRTPIEGLSVKSNPMNPKQRDTIKQREIQR